MTFLSLPGLLAALRRRADALAPADVMLAARAPAADLSQRPVTTCRARARPTNTESPVP